MLENCAIVLAERPDKDLTPYLGELLFYSLVLAPVCVSLFVDTRRANVLVLSHQKSELRSCFKRPLIYAYEEYPYIYRATYRHSIVGAPDVGPELVYLVLSRTFAPYL